MEEKPCFFASSSTIFFIPFGRTIRYVEEAREDVKNRKSFIREFAGGAGRIMYEVEEYAIEEVNCDEEGNIDMSGDIWDFSKMEIKVISEITKEIVKVFDNMEDAEQAANELDDTKIVF